MKIDYKYLNVSKVGANTKPSFLIIPAYLLQTRNNVDFLRPGLSLRQFFTVGKLYHNFLYYRQ